MTTARRCISLLQLPRRCGTRHTPLCSKLAQSRPCMLYSSTNGLLRRDSHPSPNTLLWAVKSHIRITPLSTDANGTPSPLQSLLTHVLMIKGLDLNEDMLPPEYLTPERRLMRMYETLYIMFSYIRENGDEEAGMHSLHDFEFKPADEGTDTYQAREAVVAIISSIVLNYSRIPLNALIRSHHTHIFDILGAIIALHDMYIGGSRNLVLKDWTVMWGRALPMLLTLSTSIDQAGFVHGNGEERKPL